MISDFGECEILDQLSERDRTGATGTLEFMAPELLTGNKPHQQRREAHMFKSIFVDGYSSETRNVFIPLDNCSARPLVHSALMSVAKGYKASAPDSNVKLIFPIRKGRSVYSSLSQTLKS